MSPNYSLDREIVVVEVRVIHKIDVEHYIGLMTVYRQTISRTLFL